jgi:hypothetical protein
MDPARMFKESLTPCPELENGLGQSQLYIYRIGIAFGIA